jgi:phospholipase/carboxylesterase
MNTELSGPRLAPKSGRPARQLVVFVHGYGAQGHDLIDIGRAWANFLPDAAFVSPHAPEPLEGASTGRQWFRLTYRDPAERWRGVNTAAPALHRFLDVELERCNLPASALALVGFSQGTMMSLHVGLRRAAAPAAIVGYSGLFVLPNPAAPDAVVADIRAKPPVLLVHGDSDDVIPAAALFHAAEVLAALGSPPSGTYRRASATASIRRVCATAALSWHGSSRHRFVSHLANTPNMRVVHWRRQS